MADCTGLENRHVRKGIVSSNLTLSAENPEEAPVFSGFSSFEALISGHAEINASCHRVRSNPIKASGGRVLVVVHSSSITRKSHELRLEFRLDSHVPATPPAGSQANAGRR